MSFWQEYWYVAAFYALVVLLIYVFRKKFEFQGGIVAMLRTNFGIRFMERIGKKYSKTVRVLGFIGIIVGYIGMIGIFVYLLWGLVQLTDPAAEAVLSPVLPGVPIPGSPFTLPLFEGLIALFIVILIHESAHGFVAAAHGMKIKSSGLVLLGPIAGAFVEPDEKVLKKKSGTVQNAVFAAGPWSNVLTGFLFIGLLLLAVQAFTTFATPVGFTFTGVVEGSPAHESEIPPNVLYTAIDDIPIMQTSSIADILAEKEPGDIVSLVSEEGTYTFYLDSQPNDPSKPWIGIEGISLTYDIEKNSPATFAVVGFFLELLQLLVLLSFGLGLANLIPIGPVDGGRMFQIAAVHFLGKKRGEFIWKKLAVFLLFAIILLVFVPIIRSVF